MTEYVPPTSPAPYAVKSVMQEAIIKWLDAKDAAALNGQPEPVLPNCIAISIMDICNKMARRPNFNAYTYIDDMIGDAIYDCTRAVKNFNRNHVQVNPFGYFSRVAWNAFVRRIQTEQALYKLKQDLMFDENHIAYSIIDGDEAVLSKNDVRQFLSFGE